MGWNFTFLMPFNRQDVNYIPIDVSNFMQKKIDFIENSELALHFCEKYNFFHIFANIFKTNTAIYIFYIFILMLLKRASKCM